MSATDFGPSLSVTFEELDEILDRIAATSSFSSLHLREKIRVKYAEPIRTHNALLILFRRLHSSKAKWMVHMLLKTYSLVQVPETLAIQQFHFLLPDILSFQNSFEAAVKLICGTTIRHMPPYPVKDVKVRLRKIAARKLTVQIRVIVIRPAYEKARSIKHCY